MRSFEDPITPVIVGVGQVVNRDRDPGSAPEPLDLMEEAARQAQADAAAMGLLERVDTIYVPNILSWAYSDPAGFLASRIGARPGEKGYTCIGATAPQWFTARAAERIARGLSEVALVCGAEALHTLRTATRSGRTLPWRVCSEPPSTIGDRREPQSALEVAYDLLLPLNLYALYENRLRYEEGLTLEEHRKELGELCASLSRVAASNPYSWFPEPRRADEIAEVTPANRMVSFPYTKYMCSILDVNQAAAVILTSEAKAGALGIPASKMVYPWSTAQASDVWILTERRDFTRSPSSSAAAARALELAGATIDEVSLIDLYSCFPCAPRITRRALGIAGDDPRPLTVTGGMPYFGGPGNNYTLHAICRMVELLREDREKIGLIHALSWYYSKHSYGLYGGTPNVAPFSNEETIPGQPDLDRLRGPRVVAEAKGRATVETFSLFHDRRGAPTKGLVIGRLNDGSRFLSTVQGGEPVLERMMKEEAIGREGTVRHDEATGRNVFNFR